MLENPKLAARDCQTCLVYEFNEETGEIEKDDATGEPIERLGPEYAPCRMHARGKRTLGCPKGTPEEPLTLSPQNELAVQRHEEWKATGGFPPDPLVARRAVIIEAVKKSCEDRRQEVLMLRMRVNAMTGD